MERLKSKSSQAPGMGSVCFKLRCRVFWRYGACNIKGWWKPPLAVKDANISCSNDLTTYNMMLDRKEWVGLAITRIQPFWVCPRGFGCAPRKAAPDPSFGAAAETTDPFSACTELDCDTIQLRGRILHRNAKAMLQINEKLMFSLDNKLTYEFESDCHSNGVQ